MPDISEIELKITDNSDEVVDRLRNLWKTIEEGGAESDASIQDIVTALGNADRASSAYGVEVDMLASRLRVQLQEYQNLAAMLDETIAKEGAASDSALVLRAALDQKGASAQNTAIQMQGLVRDTNGGTEASGRFASALQSVLGELRNLPGPLGQISGLIAGGIGRIGEMSLGSVAGVVGLVGGVAAMAGAAKQASDEFMDYTTQMMRMSDQTGMAVDFVARFAQAADDASVNTRGFGVEVSTVQSALQRFTMQIGRGIDADGNYTASGNRMVATLKAMGVSAEEITAKIDKPQELLMLLSDALSRVETPAQRAANAQALFGMAGRDLLPLLSQGSQGVREMMGAIDDSLVPTEAATKAARDYAKAQDALGDAIAGVKQRLGGVTTPVFTALATNASGGLDVFGASARAAAAFATGGAGSAEYRKALLDLHEALSTSTQLQDRASAKMLEALPAYQDAATQARDVEQAHRNLAAANAAVVEQASGIAPTYQGMIDPYVAIRQKVDDLKVANENAAIAADKHKTALEGIAAAVGKPWKPPSKQEQAGNIFGLATGTIKPEDFEKGQFEGVVTNLFTKGQISPEQLANIGKAVKDYGVSSSETMLAIAKTTPAARAELAGFVKVLQDQEKAAGVVGPLVETMGPHIVTKSGVVQPTDKDRLAKEEADARLKVAGQERDRAVGSEPRYKDMGMTPEEARLNTIEKSKAYDEASKAAEKASERVKPHVKTWQDFDEAILRGGQAGAQWPQAPLQPGLLPDRDDKGNPTPWMDAKAGAGAEQSQAAASVGTDLALGVLEGAKASAGELTTGLGAIFDVAIEAIRIKYQIKSPSEWMATNVGVPLIQGVAAGITNSQQDLVVAVSDAFVAVNGYITGDEATVMWSGMGESLMKTLSTAVKDNSWRLRNELKEAMRQSITEMVEFALEEARRRVR